MVVPQDVVRVRVHPSVTFIPEKAFYERNKLEEVELCDGLREIGSYAFSGGWDRRSALKRVDIPSSVRVIGSYAFDRCQWLEEVILCEGLLEIGRSAFSFCKALKRIRIPSTVTSIHKWAFAYCEGFCSNQGLEEVILCEGLIEIGNYAFVGCKSLKQIKIPSTITIINMGSFEECEKLAKVELSEGLVEIGNSAFCGCNWLKSINIPSTVKTIDSLAFAHVPLTSLQLPAGMSTVSGQVCHCKGMFSIELPESIEKISADSFNSCGLLRNLALPSNVEIGIDVFKDCEDLKKFGSEQTIINALKHRFDNLPVHKMLYYQSYGRGRVTRSIFDDHQQDTLGMTPLHILACSTVQNIEMYRMFVKKHPGSLITEDRWGALPLLYAIWGDAGSEIVDFLVQSYKSIFPNYKLNWTEMMDTLSQANVSEEEVFDRFSPSLRRHLNRKQRIDWNALVENAIPLSDPHRPIYINKHTFRFLVARSVRKRWKAMQKCKKLYNEMLDALSVYITDGIKGKQNFVKYVHRKLEVCQDKYNIMIETTTMIELALWKNKMDDCCGDQNRTRLDKKMRMDDTAMRKQCRIKCGAETNIVIKRVLPYLGIL